MFRGKIIGRARVQGELTPEGGKRFEQARARLAKLADRPVERTSDADVIEYLARGEAETLAYLERG